MKESASGKAEHGVNINPLIQSQGQSHQGNMSVEAPTGLEGLVAVAARQRCPCGPGLRWNSLGAPGHLGEVVQQVKLGLRRRHRLGTKPRKRCTSEHKRLDPQTAETRHAINPFRSRLSAPDTYRVAAVPSR